MSRDDDRCCFCRNARWEIFKRRFFPSVRKIPRYREFPQVKVPGKDWSIAGKPRQWVLTVWQERSMESQSWPVWFRGLRCMWLIWSCQLPPSARELQGTPHSVLTSWEQDRTWHQGTQKISHGLDVNTERL